MTRGWNGLRGLLAPTVPEAIRGQFAILAAGQMQRNSRLLLGAFLLTLPPAALAAGPQAGFLLRFGIPGLMCLYCLASIVMLHRDLGLASNPRRAARFITEASISSCLAAVLCSAWATLSWLQAPAETRIYFLMIVALGAFSSAYCLASARPGAIGNLAINLLPMLALLLTSGRILDLALGVSLACAALFQLRMIITTHEQLIDLLLLQRQASELARSDPLTGLLNRRALLEAAPHMAPGAPLRLLLIDIDNFKAINDRHGHDMGDLVLREVAERLAIRAEIMGSVARLGGEEFAILGAVDDLPEGLALGILADLRAAAMPHGQQVTVSIGLAEGMVTTEDDWRALYRSADAALYAAKRGGRNRLAHASPSGSAGAERAAA
jgi:diguanylate cyclase (GGDEF)-like protein